MSICKSIKEKFKDWDNINQQIYQWMLVDCRAFSKLWKDVLTIDVHCHRHNNLRYSLHRSHICQHCRNIDHLSSLGIINTNEGFTVDCKQLPNKDYIVRSYSNVVPYLQINEKSGRCNIITDVITKQYLINIWTSYNIPVENICKYYTLYQCGTNMNILMDNDMTDIRSNMTETEIEALWYQLYYVCRRLKGLFYGNPLISALKIRNKRWKHENRTYPISLCLDDFRKCRLYTREFDLSSQGQLPIMGRDYLTIYEHNNGKWIQLHRDLLTNMLKDMIEYIPTLDFYSFVINLCIYVNHFIDNKWFNQLFKDDQIDLIKSRINVHTHVHLNIDDLINILDDIWIQSDFADMNFTL